MEWFSEGDLKTGILESANGEKFPVIAGIPILTDDAQRSTALQHIQSGNADEAFYDLLNGQPAYWVENAVQTFQSLIYQFVGRWSADYFYFRRSDPTFLSGLSLLRAARGQAGWAFDLGCGCGHNCEVLLKLSPEKCVIGLDSTFKLLFLARQFIAQQADFICADLENGLPFVSGVAGTVLCSDTFSFLRNKWGAAREMMRLIKPDGRVLITRLLITPPAHWNPHRFRLFPSQFYTLFFESMRVARFADEDLRQAYLSSANIEENSSFREQEQSFSLVVSSAGLPESAVSPFLDPYDVESLYVNPLYSRVDQDGWRREWPSHTYAQDYEDKSGYLPSSIALPPEISHQQGSRSELENLLRRRVLLSLPKRYGNVTPLQQEDNK
jgi:SAM-dependent methyltransferase